MNKFPVNKYNDNADGKFNITNKNITGIKYIDNAIGLFFGERWSFGIINNVDANINTVATIGKM